MIEEMNEGIKILIFGNPLKFTHYMGQATTVCKKQDAGWMEKWEVQFDDGNIDVLISKHSNMKTINGLEDYAISEDGQVYSFKRARLMYPLIGKHYGNVSVKLNGREYGVPRMVMEHWGNPCPGKEYEPFHLDRNRTNNHFSNLKWITHSQLMIYSRENSLKDIEVQRSLPAPKTPIKVNSIQVSAEKKRRKKLCFMSISQASEYLKIPFSFISKALDADTEYNGWKFKKI